MGDRRRPGRFGRPAEPGAEKAAPSEKVISRLAKLLKDDFDALMQLAGRVPGDVAAIVKADPAMPAFLRCAREEGLSGADLMGLLEKRRRTL